jgi:hypothetical protein
LGEREVKTLEKLSRLLLAVDVLEQIHYLVGVAPLVVVPGNNPKEALLAFQVVLQGSKTVVNRRVNKVLMGLESSLDLPGTEIITFLAPPSMWPNAFSSV